MVDTAKLRRPGFASRVRVPSGRVTHDEKGNAVWQWSHNGEAVPPELNVLDSAITTDQSPAASPIKLNKTALKSGYDPYESGLIDKAPRAKKRDLRELSRRIKTDKSKVSREDSCKKVPLG